MYLSIFLDIIYEILIKKWRLLSTKPRWVHLRCVYF